MENSFNKSEAKLLVYEILKVSYCMKKLEKSQKKGKIASAIVEKMTFHRSENLSKHFKSDCLHSSNHFALQKPHLQKHSHLNFNVDGQKIKSPTNNTKSSYSSIT